MDTKEIDFKILSLKILLNEERRWQERFEQSGEPEAAAAHKVSADDIEKRMNDLRKQRGQHGTS